jgi:hypothetical protein
VANVDTVFGSAKARHPKALVETYRAALAEEKQPDRLPPPARPKYCRIDAGQMIRALLLVAACLGFAQLPRVDHAQLDKSAAAVKRIAAS